jgi:SAM-dependent methyltransferase
MDQIEYYDTFKEYDAIIDGYYKEHAAIIDLLLALLPNTTGTCLDMGCGSGIVGPRISERGFELTGLDISPVQLAIAKQKGRLKHAVHGNASAMPFDDDSFDLIVSTYTHTDIDDWDNAVREVERVLKPGGHFVYVGAHPSFFGAQAQINKADGTVTIFPGYYNHSDRAFSGPGFSKGGIRETVGEKHLSMEKLLNPIFAGKLSIELIQEDGGTDPPICIGLRATKPVL